MITLDFEDPKLQQHCEKVMSVMTSLPENLRPICALLDAYGWFKRIESEDSPRVQETIRLLSSAEMRAPLKAWYLRHNKINDAANGFRQTLESLIGEELPLRK